jgi:hypothetical protein
LGDGKVFSKINLRDAFQQLKLSGKSNGLLTVNSIVGLLQYERMPYGIKTTPQVFQKVMDKMLAGLNNVACYIDDIMIWTKTKEEHYALLNKCYADCKNTMSRLDLVSVLLWRIPLNT